VNPGRLPSINRPADSLVMEREKPICRCASRFSARPCAPAIRLRRGAEAGVKVTGIVLHIGAPKWAICWITDAGLLNGVTVRIAQNLAVIA
jgi:hypothetical protein